MESLLYCLLLVTVTVSACRGAAYKGTISAGNTMCAFTELKGGNSSGKGPRGVRLHSCKNHIGNMNVDCSYYGANPHHCGAYKPNLQLKIVAYYKALAKAAMNNGLPCTRGSIYEKICHLTYPCTSGNCLLSTI